MKRRLALKTFLAANEPVSGLTVKKFLAAYEPESVFWRRMSL